MVHEMTSEQQTKKIVVNDYINSKSLPKFKKLLKHLSGNNKTLKPRLWVWYTNGDSKASSTASNVSDMIELINKCVRIKNHNLVRFSPMGIADLDSVDVFVANIDKKTMNSANYLQSRFERSLRYYLEEFYVCTEKGTVMFENVCRPDIIVVTDTKDWISEPIKYRMNLIEFN